MKSKIRQIINDMRRQPLVSTVTFIATALTIFLFMVVVITTRVRTIPFSPESCRDRLLIGKYIHVKYDDGRGDSSGGMSIGTARRLYGGLEGVESETYYEEIFSCIVGGTFEKSFDTSARNVDAGFFKVFDHPLVCGRYFTTEEAVSNVPMAVISERTARKAFGTTDCAGQVIKLNHKDYTVTGVIKDHSFLATNACGDVFIAKGFEENIVSDNLFGGTMVALKVKDGVDFENIRRQVKNRYAALDTELAPQHKVSVYHGGPFDQKTIANGLPGSNITPDNSASDRMAYILYAILLLVPVINLSTLLHSRMRKRINEIGVRRAFGCTRMRVITDIIWENFLVTLVGGIVGVCLGMVFALNYSGLYESIETYGSGVTPPMGSVINWGTIAITVAVCFILNLISASVPAWQASRLNPVEAINSK